jgi:hypothetical protein
LAVVAVDQVDLQPWAMQVQMVDQVAVAQAVLGAVPAQAAKATTAALEVQAAITVGVVVVAPVQ